MLMLHISDKFSKFSKQEIFSNFSILLLIRSGRLTALAMISSSYERLILSFNIYEISLYRVRIQYSHCYSASSSDQEEVTVTEAFLHPNIPYSTKQYYHCHTEDTAVDIHCTSELQYYTMQLQVKLPVGSVYQQSEDCTGINDGNQQTTFCRGNQQ